MKHMPWGFRGYSALCGIPQWCGFYSFYMHLEPGCVTPPSLNHCSGCSPARMKKMCWYSAAIDFPSSDTSCCHECLVWYARTVHHIPGNPITFASRSLGLPAWMLKFSKAPRVSWYLLYFCRCTPPRESFQSREGATVWVFQCGGHW